jgi:hypothetical protein
MSGAQEIIFGRHPNQTSHAFRRVDQFGLDRSSVMRAILADLAPRLPLPFPLPNNAPFVGSVSVDGVRLRYHAYAVSEELVNVGSIRRLL